MKKQFFRISNLLLGSLITTLGFGSCKTAQQKRVLLAYGPPTTEKSLIEKVKQQEEEQRRWQAHQDSLKREEQLRIERMKVVYGPPPSRLLPPEAEDGVYEVAEQMPSFPGDEKAMREWIRSNMKYPEKALRDSIEGVVIIKCIVEADGKLSNTRVIQSVEPEIDSEALRLVNSMPQWNPGIDKGQAVRISYSIPVIFRIGNDE